MFASESSKFREERGVVVALVAMLAVVLLIFAGLALDTALLTTSKTQRRHTAEYMAFEALHTYVKTTGAPNVKVEAARSRAQDVTNLNVFVAKQYLKNWTTSSTEQIGAQNSSVTTGSHGQLTPGHWHFTPPATCPPQSGGTTTPNCPCDGLGNWTGPCFQDVDPTSAVVGLPPINAMKTDLKISATSPIGTVLTRVLNMAPFTFTVTATSALLPRVGVFLVDLSRSSHTDTHFSYEMATSASAIPYPLSSISESAFRVRNGQSCAGSPNGCMNSYNPVGPVGCQMEGGLYPPVVTGPGVRPYSLYDMIWNSGSPPYRPTFPDQCLVGPGPTYSGVRPGALQARSKHYRSDYSCFSMNFHDDGVAIGPQEYLVDTWRGPATGLNYEGPLPLVDMLHGLNYALKIAQNQMVPGDVFGAIGFDSSAKISERIVPLSQVGSAGFNDLLEITDIAGQTNASIQKRYGTYGWFIRPEGFLNLPEALQKAHDMIEAHPSTSAVRKFVALISDGMTNCDLARNCSGSEADYQYSMNESQTLIQNLYAPKKIEFSFVQIGGRSNPHTVLTKSPTKPNQCMTDAEMRAHNPPLMLNDNRSLSSNYGPAMISPHGAANYNDAGRLYESVRDTNGFYGPVREACTSGVDITSTLDAACAGGTAGVQLDAFGNPTVYPLPVTVPGRTDTSGRIHCDPLGRSSRVQVEQHLASIIGGPPLMLVE